MKAEIPFGKTSKLQRVFIQNDAVVNGGGLTGLAYNSVGLEWNYCLEGSAVITTVTTVTMTLGTWVSGGFVEVDAIKMPGWYELGLPNASLPTSGAESVAHHLQGATNGTNTMVPLPLELQLIARDIFGRPALQRSQAFADVPFVLIDSVTKLPVTGKTPTVTRCRAGDGAFAVGGITGIVEIASGLYSFDGIATDVNQPFVTFRAVATGCDDLLFTVYTTP